MTFTKVTTKSIWNPLMWEKFAFFNRRRRCKQKLSLSFIPSTLLFPKKETNIGVTVSSLQNVYSTFTGKEIIISLCMFCYTSNSHKQVLKKSRPKGNIRREVSYRLICLKLAKTHLSQIFWRKCIENIL